MLKKSGYNMRELFQTGLQQYSYYGAEVLGLDPPELKVARSRYLSLAGSQSKSSSTALSLLILGDPFWRQALGPFITYSAVVWKAATNQAFQQFIDLPRLGALAGPVIRRLSQTWGGVSGPLGAAHLSLARVGWTFETPLTVRTPSGELLALTSTSPAMICYHLQIGWKLAVARSACRAVGFKPHEILHAAEFHTPNREGIWGPQLKSLLRAFLTHAV